MISHALSSSYHGERHAVALALSGELCEHVAPEAVPAIVVACAARAGWDAKNAGDAARDTVRRVALGRAVRRDLPPALRAAVDEATGARPEPVESLADVTARLEAALLDAPDGLSVVAVGCGVGKTRAAENAAVARAERGGTRRHNTRTVISVPTNELALQVTKHLRGRGLPVLRAFGPATLPGPHGGRECRYAAAAAHLATGKLSVRWELCEGRGKAPCDYRKECRAADGAEGPADARIVVGNHGLLGELEAHAGTTGLLVIDEPPPPFEDLILDAADLAATGQRLHLFAPRYGAAMAPALAAVAAWLPIAPIAEAGPISRALPLAPPELLEQAFAATGAVDAAEAVGLALEPRQRTPPVERREIGPARSNPSAARKIGEAARVLGAVHRAITDEGVVAAVYEAHTRSGLDALSGSGRRVLALTAVRSELASAIRREGRTVLTAADAELYLEHYERVVGYPPHLVVLRAPDGCAVRRVVVRTKRATRGEWLVRGRRPAGALRAALALCAGPTAVVTFAALEGWLRAELAALGRPDVAVGHYGALRGLDAWKDLDALVTLGDPWPNLDAAARTSVDARAAAAAELEQAHGRLRLVHRSRPATCVHVGDVLPAGWRPPIEEVDAGAGGRPARAPGDLGRLQELVQALGGLRAASRAATCGLASVSRYVAGEAACPPEVLAALERAASALPRDDAARVFRKPPIRNPLLGVSGTPPPLGGAGDDSYMGVSGTGGRE